MEWRTPGYMYYYFFERHVLGFVTHTQPHGNAPWYLVPALSVARPLDLPGIARTLAVLEGVTER